MIDDIIARAQLVKILVLFDITSNRTSTFQDVPTTHWSYDYIAALADNGITMNDNGNFRPYGPVSQAQFMAFMHLLQVCHKEDVNFSYLGNR